jgi:predicted anti-sigma-YlaC factor YlaD
MSASDAIPCRELVELATEYYEGTLPPAQHAAVEAHLGCCGWCRAYLEQIRVTVRVVGDVAPEAVDPAVEAGLLELYRKLKKDGKG